MGWTQEECRWGWGGEEFANVLGKVPRPQHPCYSDSLNLLSTRSPWKHGEELCSPVSTASSKLPKKPCPLHGETSRSQSLLALFSHLTFGHLSIYPHCLYLQPPAIHTHIHTSTFHYLLFFNYSITTTSTL